LARAARKATLTVSNIKSLGIRLRQQVKIIFTLADKLCDLGGLKLSETPGFALSESAADSIKGFALDSLYLDMRAGGEMFFFRAQELDEKNLEGDQDGVTYDLAGRQNRLNYKVKPIVLASFKMDGGIDLMGIPGFINFDLGYKTDRVYQSGGSVESDSGQELLKDLNASGLVSDALSVGAAVLGIRAAFKKAVFNSGQVEVIDDATGAVLARGPLRLDLTQFDLTYDLTWAIDSEKFKKLFDELAVGFRYLNYKLPRILYELTDSNGDPDKDEYIYVRESPVQFVESEYFLIGAQGHRAHPVSERLKVLFDLGIHFGGGPTTYYLTTPSDAKDEMLWTLVGSGELGLAYGFSSPRSNLKFEFQVLYNGQVIYAVSGVGGGSDDNDLGDTQVNFGGVDIFHGPKAQLRLSF
jgi:hypothetical protein